MFFRRRRTLPTGYVASSSLLTYFITGLIILSLAFVFYTRQILRLNQSLVKQVEPLADFAAEIPSLKEESLQTKLNEIVKRFLSSSRLSFIVVDVETAQVVTARGLDKALEAKIASDAPLSAAEKTKLEKAVRRLMKNTADAKPIQYLPRDLQHEVSGYIYYGEAASTAIAQVPFVITDIDHKPKKWQIWDGMIKAEEATLEQYAQAERLIQNSRALRLYAPLQTNPSPRQGYLYYEAKPNYAMLLMPLVLAAVFSTFLLVGFLSYRRVKTCEQASIWGGLAKETAHQLGTPISSLMGWLELSAALNSSKGDGAAAEIYDNMKNDIARLQKITARFGKIGSRPQKTLIDVNAVIADVVTYFQKRLPNRSKRIEIRAVNHDLPCVMANAELLQWVFENLIRNSLDAVDKETGLIEIQPSLNTQLWPEHREIVITYRDNGKGIPRKDRSKIFHPGMTTKKHGWGLGLTLVKRIVEEYHNGRVRLVDTGPEGTTFEIVLPVETVGKPVGKALTHSIWRTLPFNRGRREIKGRTHAKYET